MGVIPTEIRLRPLFSLHHHYRGRSQGHHLRHRPLHRLHRQSLPFSNPRLLTERHMRPRSLFRTGRVRNICPWRVQRLPAYRLLRLPQHVLAQQVTCSQNMRNQNAKSGMAMLVCIVPLETEAAPRLHIPVSPVSGLMGRQARLISQHPMG